jgi:hypothetical protein
MAQSTTRSAHAGATDREFPSLSEYWDTLHLDLGIVLADPALAGARVCSRAPGRPVVYGGTFAYTFKLVTVARAYALRCFHREFEALQLRYEAIQAHLLQIRSPHFAGLQFHPSGITTETGDYPVVRLDWVEGLGLASYVAHHLGDAAALQQLRLSLRRLAQHLHANGVAHGDIQPSNVIVQADGNLCLIDYDGMFVPALAPLTSVDLGQRNFQHPGRRPRNFDASLDAFPFAVIDVALHALCLHPELWDLTASGEDAFLFRATDISDPSQSAIFRRLGQEAAIAGRAQDLAAVCTAPFELVPSFEDFLAGRNLPENTGGPRGPSVRAGYVPVCPVVDASDFSQCCKHVGERVELVGRVVHAVRSTTDEHRPAFLNLEFDLRPRDMACATVWAEALSDAGITAANDWVGQWVSAIGLVEPVARIGSDMQHRKHVSVSVTETCQLRRLPEAEAHYRLAVANDPGEHPVGQAGAVWTEPVERPGPAVAPEAVATTTLPPPVIADVARPKPPSHGEHRRRWWPVAAAVVLAAIAGFVLMPNGSDRPTSKAVDQAPVEVSTPGRATQGPVAEAPAVTVRPMLKSQRALTPADVQIDTVSGTLQVSPGEAGACRRVVRHNDEVIPGLCDEELVFLHQAVFDDRDVVVGFRRCGGTSPPCGWRRPFWLELRKGVPATLREQAGVWAGSADIAVQANDDGVLVDLGTWNGERRATALTAAGNLVVTRAQLPPKPLGRADCAMVARSLEDCVASRQCGSFADAARRIPAAQWTSLQRLYHETTGLDVEAYRKLCVRSCELGLLPSRGLVRQYACDGAPTGQWPADNPAGGLER